MGLVIFDIDEDSFKVENINGEDLLVGYEGEPDLDSDGNLEFHIIDAEGLNNIEREAVLDLIREEAPQEIISYLIAKSQKEAEMWKEDKYM